MVDTSSPFQRLDFLRGVRVLDASVGIPGPYASKLLVDMGADVVKIERPGGDPLRTYAPEGAGEAELGGALFQFLNASKESVAAALEDGDSRGVLGDAALLIVDENTADETLAAIREGYPHLSILSMTPFGRTGPWAARPATELTLQAASGALATVGMAEREPTRMGGQLGEWAAGTYGALACMEMLRAARTTGQSQFIDLSLLECMCSSLAMGPHEHLRQSMGVALERIQGSPRNRDLPSIERASDGYVGFCVVTPEQTQNFFVLIERYDWLDDDEMWTLAGRLKRQTEFQNAVDAWVSRHTRKEVEALASELRIPVASVGEPPTIVGESHYVERGVFRPNPGGAFVEPRSPFQVHTPHGTSTRSGAPRLDQHAAASPKMGDDRREGLAPPRPSSSRSSARPLEGVRVLDLTIFFAGPSATSQLAYLGADVIKVEGLSRVDGMRLVTNVEQSVDKWWEWSGSFQGLNAGKRSIGLDLKSEQGRSILLDLVKQSDVVVENFSPRVLDQLKLTWEELSAANPALVLVRMPAFGLSGPWRDRTGFAQTMEQATGLAWVTGYPDGPPMIPRGPSDPIAGTHAAFATMAALEERDRTGQGVYVEVPMVEVMLNVAAQIVIEHSAYGTRQERSGNRGMYGWYEGVFRCQGADEWVAITVQDDDQWTALCKVLGRLEWIDDARFSTMTERHQSSDAVDELLNLESSNWDAATLADQLCIAGVPAARVADPGQVLNSNEHLRARGFVKTMSHPIVGQHELAGVPVRLLDEPLEVAPAPCLGEHNEEILSDILGLDASRIQELELAGVVGVRPLWAS